MFVKNLFVSGFKSFSPERPLELALGRINLLIGANGAGKSNSVAMFDFLRSAYFRSLQNYVSTVGVASLLHGGPQRTKDLQVSLKIESPEDGQLATYRLGLRYGLPAHLYVAEESYQFLDNAPRSIVLPYDNGDSHLQDVRGEKGASSIAELLSGIRLYQFNNTAQGAPIRLPSGLYDCASLRSDGSNLAAYLNQLKLHDEYAPYYRRITAIIRSVMPQFKDFVFETTKSGSVWLNWCDQTHVGYVMGPHQISDGALRFMALATALLSPPDLMPRVIVLDEPELGLHPLALAKLSGMIKMAASTSQVIVATQSSVLLDSFDLSQVKVVDWDRQLGCTCVRSLDPNDYKAWLDDYNLNSDLWEKNILGGQP